MDDLKTDDVLQRNIPWETYLTARLISDRDLQLIRRFDKATETKQATLIEEQGPAFVEAFMTVLRNVTKEETVQYTLALLERFAEGGPHKAALLNQQSPAHLASITQPYVILSRLLTRNDWFTQEKACHLLSIVLELDEKNPNRDVEASTATRQQFLEWLKNQLRRPTHATRSVPTAIKALGGALRNKDVRRDFAKSAGSLVGVMRGTLTSTSPARAQVLYETGLCLWQLSFEPEALEPLRDGEVVHVLAELLKGGNKEKVMRIALMALKNLMDTKDPTLLSQVIEVGLPRLIKIRSAQSWADEDIPDLLESMDEKIDISVTENSSYEKYKAEVLSGNLDWTPMHKQRSFWEENRDKLEEKDFQVLRVLIGLLERSRDSRVLAVACHDLGMFADVHPHGRFIINDLRGKELVMRLMAHPDPEVQKQSLLCVQHLMLGRDKLDFLKMPSSSNVASTSMA